MNMYRSAFNLKSCFAFLLTALLFACATPPPLAVQKKAEPAEAPKPIVVAPIVNSEEVAALRKLVSLQDKLDRLAAPLLLNNAELCKNQARNLLGFTAKNKYSYSAEFSNEANSTFGWDERLQVTSVLVGSGAAKAGVLHPGDILVAVEDKPLPQGPNAEGEAAKILGPLVKERATQDSSEIKLSVMRGDRNLVAVVPLTFACGFRVELGNADNVNTYADGRRIMVTRGMMDFVRSDEELVYVMAKEMAHNVLAHAITQHMSATIGGIIDNLIHVHPDMSTLGGMGGIKPMPKVADALADSLSLYMVARAGYSVDNAVQFWQRLADQYPATVLNGHTALHPATAYRLVSMEKTVVLVKAKQANKRPLVP